MCVCYRLLFWLSFLGVVVVPDSMCYAVLLFFLKGSGRRECGWARCFHVRAVCLQALNQKLAKVGFHFAVLGGVSLSTGPVLIV